MSSGHLDDHFGSQIGLFSVGSDWLTSDTIIFIDL